MHADQQPSGSEHIALAPSASTSSFADLEAVLSQLFATRQSDLPLRAWLTACATGEEAYILAMLLYEQAALHTHPTTIQVFASDSDEAVIATARHGRYPLTIATRVSPERLRRFFIREPDGYRVAQPIRDLVLFAQHDLWRDPPFSRLDLLVCRNLLLSLAHETQERLLKLFYFVLNPNGLLMLGPDESVPSQFDLFSAVEEMQQLYRRNNLVQRVPHLVPSLSKDENYLLLPSQPPPKPALLETSFAALHQQLVITYGDPSVIIDSTYMIVYLTGTLEPFLQFTSGIPSYNLLTVSHPDLRLELHTALVQAEQRGMPAAVARLPLRLDHETRLVNIHIYPIQHLSGIQGLLWVRFTDLGSTDIMVLPRKDSDVAPMLYQLNDELFHLREQLHLTVEQYEVSTAELLATNEELQLKNEELRTTTEELETSQEELQSVNEELMAVNHEYRNTIEEISRSHNDIQNLMAATAIATLFVDRKIRITRYTPAAVAIFNLIATDLNRPLYHITHVLDNTHLLRDVEQVLHTQSPSEREMRSLDNRWYLARFQPYRTVEGMIEGAVLTFVDITARKQAEEQLQAAHDALEARVAERTTALAASNQALQAEVAQRIQAEQGQQELLRQLMEAQEAERLRLARDLHDQLGQQITGLLLGLKQLEMQVQGGPLTTLISPLQSLALQMSKEAHRLAMNLRPTALDDVGLVPALERLVTDWSRQAQVVAAVHSLGLEQHRLPPSVEVALYRIVQEALNNVQKHAAAQIVSVLIERRTDLVQVIIEDDGCGYDMNAKPVTKKRPSLGILGMRERVGQLSGTLEIESSLGGGTTVFVRIPLNDEGRVLCNDTAGE